MARERESVARSERKAFNWHREPRNNYNEPNAAEPNYRDANIERSPYISAGVNQKCLFSIRITVQHTAYTEMVYVLCSRIIWHLPPMERYGTKLYMKHQNWNSRFAQAQPIRIQFFSNWVTHIVCALESIVATLGTSQIQIRQIHSVYVKVIHIDSFIFFFLGPWWKVVASKYSNFVIVVVVLPWPQ